MHTRVCIHISACVHVYGCMFTCICIYMYVCIYTYVWVCVHARTHGARDKRWGWGWGRTYLGDERESMGHIYMCTCAHVWAHVHTHVAISICLSAYLSTCLLVCLFIRLYRGVISVPMLSFSTNSRHSHDHAVSSRWGCVGSRMRRGYRFRKPYRLCILMSDAT